MYRTPKRAISTFSILSLVVFTLLGTYQPVQAANTLEVTVSLDEFDLVGSGFGCSLREAIRAAKMNAPFGGCQADVNTDTIYLPAREYLLTITGDYEDAGASGDLDIQENLTITGAGSATTIINAAGLGDRIFHIRGGAGSPTVRISDLELRGGRNPNPAPGSLPGTTGGGGILNYGATLRLDRVAITANGNNNAVGGGISNPNGAVLFVSASTISNNTGSYGGGIYNAGAVTILDSTITGNTAKVDGGGLASVLGDTSPKFTQITRTSILGNHVTNPLHGAGVSSNGRLAIHDSIVADNTGIGLLINSGSNASITSSQFRGNVSTDLANGAGINSFGTLAIQNCQVSGNAGNGVVLKSGMTDPVTIWKTSIEQNQGLGLKAISEANVTLTNSKVTENTPSDPAGGAGIASAGNLTVNYSTIANNAGTGLLVSGGSAALTNTTIGDNNAAADPAHSAGIANAGSLTLHSSTIADHSGVGLRLDGNASAWVRATLFARNAAANCSAGETGTFESQGHNLRDNADATSPTPCAFEGSDLVGLPLLDAQLKDNGGSTQTYALLEGANPAVDAIDSQDPACLVVDQRGYGRPVDGDGNGTIECDIGAFELGAVGYGAHLPVIHR